MRSSHTLGPWLVGRNDGFSVPINAHNELAFDLATVNHGGIDREAIANAHLIAAAPDLLDALKALRANVERDLSGYWTESTSNFMQQADAAIAKAEGL